MSPDRLNEIAHQFNLAHRGEDFSITLTDDEMFDIADLALDGLTFRNQTMEIDMQNRDYFSKPVQGSRSQHDYGRSGPIMGPQDDVPNWRTAFLWAVPVSVVFWGVLWAVWTMLP